jgi:hypothetical protein
MSYDVYHETNFGRIKFDKDNRILIVEFFPSESETVEEIMEMDKYLKDFLLKYVEAFMHYRTSKVLFDYRKLYLPISDEFTKWVIENVVKKTVANGLMKLAQVYPEDIITKLGLEILVEQTLTQAPGPKRMLFDDYHQAFEWLKKD